MSLCTYENIARSEYTITTINPVRYTDEVRDATSLTSSVGEGGFDSLGAPLKP